MNFASTIVGTAERVPLPNVIIMCAAIHRLCLRTAPTPVPGGLSSIQT
jgi:cyclopropane-fatty-acyl-phospholipid synthase